MPFRQATASAVHLAVVCRSQSEVKIGSRVNIEKAFLEVERSCSDDRSGDLYRNRSCSSALTV